jgi:hypothetical protein
MCAPFAVVDSAVDLPELTPDLCASLLLLDLLLLLLLEVELIVGSSSLALKKGSTLAAARVEYDCVFVVCE